MKAFALILCLASLAVAADSSGPDEKTRIKLAEYMLKTPLNEADPGVVSGFMKLDAAALPVKLREKARAKQMEIDAFVKIHDGKKKGPFRFPSTTCTPKRYGPEGVNIMAMIPGNSEIQMDEEAFLEKRSECTEDQLICEFTLNVVVIPRKDKPALRRYWLMEADPLNAFLAEYHAKGGGGVTNYFGTLKPTCQKLAGSP